MYLAARLGSGCLGSSCLWNGGLWSGGLWSGGLWGGRHNDGSVGHFYLDQWRIVIRRTIRHINASANDATEQDIAVGHAFVDDLTELMPGWIPSFSH